jgi:transposase-like protein
MDTTPATSDAHPSPVETSERYCPHCLSAAVMPMGHVLADRNGIRSAYRCRDCAQDFVLLLG